MKTTSWLAGLLAVLGLVGCAPGTRAGRTTPRGAPAVTVTSAPVSSVSSLPARSTGSPLVREPRRDREPVGPVVVSPAFSPFGRVTAMDERRALASIGAPAIRPAALPQRYERWHERRRTDTGYGYLFVAEPSVDDRFLLVVSDEEARIRTYDFATLRPISLLAAAGYAKFERGGFALWPLDDRPSVLFANGAGITLTDTRTGQTRQVSTEGAYGLRWSEDHRVLGATLSRIPEQRSRLVFYAPQGDSTLEPLLALDFAERVDDWDLDREKRRLVVTYYPSNQVEVLDLSERRALWVAVAPEYSGSVDISNDDRRLAVGGSKVVLFDLARGAPIGEDAHFGNNIAHVLFSPSDDALAVSSYEGKVRIFDATRPGPVMPLRKVLRHTGTANVYALAWSRDGSELVSSSGDKTVRVWGE